MAMAASRLPISIEQYLEAELTAPVKHEYVAGHIYAMVGTSKAHNLVALALASALRSHLQGRPCQVFMADIKVYMKNATALYYPDVVVACDRGGSDRAYLLVGGGHYVWEETIESLVNPRQSEIEQIIEPRFTPAHTHPFEALLNQPFTGTFH
jgi:Putative restriction endonuclease